MNASLLYEFLLLFFFPFKIVILMFVYQIVFTNHAVYPEHLVLQHASATVLFNNSHNDDDDDDNYDDDAAIHGASCIFQIEKLNDLAGSRVFFSFLL